MAAPAGANAEARRLLLGHARKRLQAAARARRPRLTAPRGRRSRSRHRRRRALRRSATRPRSTHGGQRDPSVLYDAAHVPPLLHGARLSRHRARSATRSTTEDAGTKQPDNGLVGPQRAAGRRRLRLRRERRRHPSVIKDGATYVMYYTGPDRAEVSKIGRATAASAGRAVHPRLPPQSLDVGAAGEFDARRSKDPVVVKARRRRLPDALHRRRDARGRDGSSASGTRPPTRRHHLDEAGVVLDPSLARVRRRRGGRRADRNADRRRRRCTSGRAGIDRSGRTRGGPCDGGIPDSRFAAQPGVPSGWATYQLGDSSTTNARLPLRSSRTSTGSYGRALGELPAAVLVGGNEFWSDYFPVTVASPTEALNFLLTVRGVRWQARLSRPSGNPALDKVEITHAPVSFSPTGSATSTSIGPSAGRAVTAWKTLTATMNVFSPGGGGSASANARLLDAVTGEQVAAAPIARARRPSTSTGVNAAAHQSLRVVSSSSRRTVRRRRGSQVVQGHLRERLRGSAAAAPPPVPPTLTLVAAPKTIVFGARRRCRARSRALERHSPDRS